MMFTITVILSLNSFTICEKGGIRSIHVGQSICEKYNWTIVTRETCFQ